MTRVLRFKEKLALALMATCFSIAGVFSRKTLQASSAGEPYSSQFITGPKGIGLELAARRPYARFVRASLAPVSLPLVAGAYVALAGASGAPAAAAAGDQCSSCNVKDPPCCSVTATACCNADCGGGCWTVQCSSAYQERTGGFTCVTCGAGTCPACF